MLCWLVAAFIFSAGDTLTQWHSGCLELKPGTKRSSSILREVKHNFIQVLFMLWAGIAQSVQRLATGWTVRESNPGKGKIPRTRPDRLWNPPSLLYNGYRVSFLGLKRPGRGVNHPPPTSAEVKVRVELYLYSGPLWPVLGRTFYSRTDITYLTIT